ncbi:MAG: hypothetical protein EXS49_02580 [Candidatus Pacebacteria bacterium]|nr:hypothetical protein [Candidatus Paceibacterota bacterium]
MGIFDQFKQASEMLKGMSPEQIKDMMAQAKEQKAMMEEVIKKGVEDEIKKKGLVSKEELLKILKDRGL